MTCGLVDFFSELGLVLGLVHQELGFVEIFFAELGLLS